MMGVQVYKALIIKKPVHRKGQGMPHPKHCTKRAGAEPQVGLFPQKFQAVFFWLQGVLIRVAIAQYLNGLSLHFHCLPAAGAGYQHTAYFEAGPGGDAFQEGFLRVFKIHDNL